MCAIVLRVFPANMAKGAKCGTVLLTVNFARVPVFERDSVTSLAFQIKEDKSQNDSRWLSWFDWQKKKEKKVFYLWSVTCCCYLKLQTLLCSVWGSGFSSLHRLPPLALLRLDHWCRTWKAVEPDWKALASISLIWGVDISLPCLEFTTCFQGDTGCPERPSSATSWGLCCFCGVWCSSPPALGLCYTQEENTSLRHRCEAASLLHNHFSSCKHFSTLFPMVEPQWVYSDLGHLSLNSFLKIKTK